MTQKKVGRKKIGELTKKNEKALKEYELITVNRFNKKSTQGNNIRPVEQMLRNIGKDYSKITLQDVLKWLGRISPVSAEVYKTPICRFFKQFKMDELANDIPRNNKILGEQTKGEESVLTPDEIDKVIESPRQLMDRALNETYIVTGARKNEIVNLNVGDIKVEPDVVFVNIRTSKTNVRKIPIVPNEENPTARYPKYLIQWLRYRKGKPNDPLFISPDGNRIKEHMVADKYRWINRNLDLDKRVTTHIYRHTAATYDGAYLNESMMCQKYGWTLGSTMVRRYCHFTTKQLVEQMLKHAGIKQEEAKAGKTCPRCQEVNNINAKVCSRCDQILDTKSLFDRLNEQEKEKEHQRERINKLEARLHEFEEQQHWQEQAETRDLWKEIMKEQIAILKKQDVDVSKLEALL